MASTNYMDGAGSPFAPLASLMVDATAAALDGLRTVTINPITSLAKVQGRVKQRRQLRDMDARMLADIGLDRVTADLEAAKPFWKA